MSDSLTVALAQIDPKVGDLEGNLALAAEAIRAAEEEGCDLVVLPELALIGYPPEDLLFNQAFVERSERAVRSLAAETGATTALVGCAEATETGLYNSVAVLAGGSVRGHARKSRLPNYGVFDERRYFEPARAGTVIEVGGVTVSVSVCEDIWFPGEPLSSAVASGARLAINCSASPFHVGKGSEREAMLSGRAREHGVPVAYCALVGGQDELVFDGQSLAFDAGGRLLARGRQFETDFLVVDIPLADQAPSSGKPPLVPAATLERAAPSAPVGNSPAARIEPELGAIESIEAALCLGLADYVGKNGFNGVVLGISGGIDSAVALTLAVDSLGAERVTGVVMPSPWSSTETQSDARDLCDSLGVSRLELPIEPAMEAYARTLQDAPSGPGDALADENIQARIRGNLLMALSNRHGWLVVTTGNKSELAVGYSTLYGDAAGGFGLLKDVPKGTVYELARLRNSREDSPIPISIIDRAPSAELRPGQRDEDSLPPYRILDEILRLYVEERLDLDAIVARGPDAETVDRVLRLVDRAEYKRRQYPPGVKITPLAFGRDRRMPMTNGFRD